MEEDVSPVSALAESTPDRFENDTFSEGGGCHENSKRFGGHAGGMGTAESKGEMKPVKRTRDR
jgi:hypothetical protein